MTDVKTMTISTRSHGEAVVRVLSETEGDQAGRQLQLRLVS